MQPYQTFEEICAGLATRPEAWAKICEGQSYIPLLPFLEHPYSAVMAQLVDRLVAVGLARAEAERVSLRQLVVFALTGPMRWGWGGYAVSWIEAGFPIDDEIASALRTGRAGQALCAARKASSFRGCQAVAPRPWRSSVDARVRYGPTRGQALAHLRRRTRVWAARDLQAAVLRSVRLRFIEYLRPLRTTGLNV